MTMKRFFLTGLIGLSLLALFSGCLQMPPTGNPPAQDAAPVTHPPISNAAFARPMVSLEHVFVGLAEFANEVLNGDPETVVGVFVEGHFALPVSQQPQGQPAYVSETNGVLTQFSMASSYGVIGLLAHNYLSGKLFFSLKQGDEVVVLFGDGAAQVYRVSHTESFHALNSASPHSDFIDTSDTQGTTISSSELFDHIYSMPGRLVFQTCIEANGDPSWGRYFVLAEKGDTPLFHLSSQIYPNNP